MRTVTLVAFLLNFHHAFSQTDTLYGYVDSATYRPFEISPAFPGGPTSWNKFLEKNQSREDVRGTVIIEFTVPKDGTTSKNVRVFKSVDPNLDNEAVRLVKMIPWKPGIQNGRNVSCRIRVAIDFPHENGKPTY